VTYKKPGYPAALIAFWHITTSNFLENHKISSEGLGCPFSLPFNIFLNILYKSFHAEHGSHEVDVNDISLHNVVKHTPPSMENNMPFTIL